MAKNVLTYNLSEPLNSTTAAKIEISSGSGNMMIDQLTSGEKLLASGTLQYFENKDLPNRSVNTSNGLTTLTLKAGFSRQSCFRLPWETCNGATEWQIHLNPGVQSDITAHSGGGNVKINLAGMAVSQLSADTGGGNMDVVLPDNASDLNASVKSGAGNVTVEVGRGITGNNAVYAKSGAGNVVIHTPEGVSARIHTSSGMGKIIMDPKFTMIDKNTYQSPDYEAALDKVEITAHSGAGNVIINSK
jgi:DUF4097 and DUF4098 domain-containing protein YvlB